MAMCAGTDNSGQNVDPGHICHLKQISERSISIVKAHHLRLKCLTLSVFSPIDDFVSK